MMVYARLSGGPPLRDRYDALVAKVCAAGGTAAVPASEENCDLMQNWLESRQRQQAPEPEPPPMAMGLRVAMHGVNEAFVTYDVLAARTTEAITAIKRKKSTVQERATVLGLPFDDHMLEPSPTRRELVLNQFGGTGYATHVDCATVELARHATNKILLQAKALQDRLVVLDDLVWLSEAKAEDNHALMHFGRRIKALEDMVKSIAAEHQEIIKLVEKLSATAKKGKHRG